MTELFLERQYIKYSLQGRNEHYKFIVKKKVRKYCNEINIVLGQPMLILSKTIVFYSLIKKTKQLIISKKCIIKTHHLSNG